MAETQGYEVNYYMQPYSDASLLSHAVHLQVIPIQYASRIKGTCVWIALISDILMFNAIQKMYS